MLFLKRQKKSPQSLRMVRGKLAHIAHNCQLLERISFSDFPDIECDCCPQENNRFLFMEV